MPLMPLVLEPQLHCQQSLSTGCGLLEQNWILQWYKTRQLACYSSAFLTPLTALSLDIINLLISTNNCQLSWLFLVTVILPLSMSFSFDSSGIVCLAAFLTFCLFNHFLFPYVLLLLIYFPSLPHTEHTSIASTHLMSCFSGWWSLAEAFEGEKVVMRDTGWHWDSQSGCILPIL